MTIDSTTLLIVALTGITLFCVIGFVRSLLRERRDEMVRRINEVEETIWRENEKMWERINNCQRSCREQACRGKEYPAKNHYNTEA